MRCDNPWRVNHKDDNISATKCHTNRLCSHITLGTYENIDRQELIDHTKYFCENYTQINIAYTGIGIMSQSYNFLYIIPRVTTELLTLYKCFHQRLDEYCNDFTSFAKWKWTPHTTLCGYTKEVVDTVVQKMQYIEGKIIGLKLIDCTDDDYAELYRGYFNWLILTHFEETTHPKNIPLSTSNRI